MSLKNTWTNKSLLEWTTEYFSKHGVSSPRLNSETLLAMALEVDRVKLYMDWDSPLDLHELALFKGLIKRRIAHEPLQHITGFQDFWTLHLHVNPSVLIPRQDSETLIETALEFCEKDAATAILDLCTGSGNLALALAYELKNAALTASDISEDAIKTAKKNAIENSLEDRVTFICGNLFDAVLSDDTFDIIVSNPPYISTDEIKTLDNEVKMFEPLSALDGGSDGLKFYRKIVAESKKYLKDGGLLFFEIGCTQSEEVEGLLRDAAFSDVETRKDYAGKNRVVFGKN